MVAPLVGAWIEIRTENRNPGENMSLPSWERGLKYVTPASVCQAERSLPSWERGLKLTDIDSSAGDPQSLPSWERGLKYSGSAVGTSS